MQVLKCKEEAEGLNPTGTTSNIGPTGKTFCTKFNCLSIRIGCLCVSLCCMPSALLGFPIQDPRVILPQITFILFFKSKNQISIFSFLGRGVCFKTIVG